MAVFDCCLPPSWLVGEKFLFFRIDCMFIDELLRWSMLELRLRLGTQFSCESGLSDFYFWKIFSRDSDWPVLSSIDY